MAELPCMEDAVSLGHVDGVEFEKIAAQYGTPCYIYSTGLIQTACRHAKTTVAPVAAKLSYAVKANGNLAILDLICKEGLGFDVASHIELERVVRIGGPMARTIFTGPGKSRQDLQHAIEHGVSEIICESAGELERIAEIVTQKGSAVTVGIRVNPDIDAKTHPHITTGRSDTKFGVPPPQAIELMNSIAATADLQIGSLNCHIGSQIMDEVPFITSAQALNTLCAELVQTGITPECLDLGGGFGIGDSNHRPSKDVLAQVVAWLTANLAEQKVGFQPGRLIVGRAGILLTRVEYRKKHHIIVDAGMTELMRPALYGAVHGVAHIGGHPAGPGDLDIVGPVCESADFLAKGVNLDAQPGELVAVFDTGAYASAMASSYNGRLQPCEVLVTDGIPTLIRQRGDVADALRPEIGLHSWIG